MELCSIIDEVEFDFEGFPELQYAGFRFSSMLIDLNLVNLKELKLVFLQIISEDFRPSTQIKLKELPPGLKYLHATESYFMTGEMGNPPQLEHLILYSEEEEVVESFAGLIKDGLKTLGLGRDAKLLLSNIEPLQTVTKLDLDSADDSLDILNFPNLKNSPLGQLTTRWS